MSTANNNAVAESRPPFPDPAPLFAKLEALGIQTKTVEHEPTFTVADNHLLGHELPGAHVKNLFVRDKKGKRMWMLICRENKPVDLKASAAVIGADRLSFGSPDRMQTYLGISPGSVSAFALLNDTTCAVTCVIDDDVLQDDIINVHPWRCDRTTAIARDDLLRFLEDIGHKPQICTLL